MVLSDQGTPIFIFIFDIISGSLLVWNFIIIVSSDRTVERYSLKRNAESYDKKDEFGYLKMQNTKRKR